MIQSLIELLQQLFSPLTNLFANSLEFLHSLGIPWWLSIVILTAIVRSLLFPLTVKQVRSARAMQELAPELKKIRAKYKDNPQKQKEEQFKLYQDRQVNPLGGCLPVVVQMPIFITVYYVIRSFETTHESFATGGILWFHDLSMHDPFYILPVVSAVTMLASMEITSKNAEPQQRWIMRLLPIGASVFLAHFPAGLFMYWITTNLVTLGQNYLIYNFGPGRKTPAAAEEQPSTRTKEPSLKSPVSQNNDTGSGQRTKGAGKRRRKKKK